MEKKPQACQVEEMWQKIKMIKLEVELQDMKVLKNLRDVLVKNVRFSHH